MERNLDSRDILDLKKDLNSKETERILTKFITKLLIEDLENYNFSKRETNWITIRVSKLLKVLKSMTYGNLYYEMIREKYGITLGDVILDIYDHGNFQIDLVLSIITGIDFFPGEQNEHSKSEMTAKFMLNEINLFNNDLFTEVFYYFDNRQNEKYDNDLKYSITINTSELSHIPNLKNNKFFDLLQKIKDMSINDNYLSSVLESNHLKYINDIYDDIFTLKDLLI